MSKNSLPTERRRVQRVQLIKPLRATLGRARVFVIDLSMRGVRIAHQEDIGRVASACELRTEWEGTRFQLQCQLVRTALHRAADTATGNTLYHSGLLITGMNEHAQSVVRTLIAHHVERALDEQKANARGIPPHAAHGSQPNAPSTFVRHEYTGGRWREVRTPAPNQPDNGFTISAEHSPSEVEMLRRAYESAATNNDRAIIRRFAALSLSTGEPVPIRRYQP